jgi:hypothetical protein
VNNSPAEPLFDSTRAMLAFAINADFAVLPRPAMAKAAEGDKKPRRKKKVDPLQPPEPPPKRALSRVQHGLLGLDAAGQAGIILQHFQRLDQAEQAVLAGAVAKPTFTCGCGSPCCRGYRYTSAYGKAITSTYEAVLLGCKTAKGKPGLSTEPRLRRAVIHQYFTKRETGLQELADMAEVSLGTVASHKALIYAFLEETEQSGWLALDEIFDQSGLLGALG